MNAMTNALKQAGVNVPSKAERIWNWVKDHQPSSVHQIATALGMKENNTSSMCGQMAKRGMMTFIKESRNGKYGWRNVHIYSTKGKVYALKPMPKPTAKSSAAPETEAPVVASPATPDQESWEALLDRLNVKHARLLYEELRRMFQP